MTSTFQYNNNTYFYTLNSDPSTNGCITEIVNNNEYVLDMFNNKNTTFIDIGANCGIATIILAKQNPMSIIYSFEPDKTVFELLQQNIKLNNLTNVKTFNKAVSKEGVKYLDLCLHPNYSGGNTTYSNTHLLQTHFNGNIHSYRVECISLDKIIEDNNITEIELLKIDCEGAEYDILYNSVYFKNNIVKNLVGEFHNLKYNIVEDTAENLIIFCKSFVEGVLKITTLDI